MAMPRHPDRFIDRHIGPNARDVVQMLEVLGKGSLDALIDATVPKDIRLDRPLDLPPGRSEYGLLHELRQIAAKNRICRSYLGMGYSDTVTPPVIQRNILENPGWYTQYTPYQPEISQGRLEALLNYQTMVIDLTGLPVANASLLDEGTAAAEAMSLVHAVSGKSGSAFFVASDCHPQTIEVVRTRAEPRGVQIVVGDHQSFRFDERVFGALLQYPASDGAVLDYRELIQRAHAAGSRVVMACDLL
ncbi:MAG: glycine dehydrogenase (aminomethyl-transferring), partial [Myxococcales bacterium]